MKVNLLNTGNYEVYRRSDPAGKSSGSNIVINNPHSKNSKNKIIVEGEILNSGKVNIKEDLNPYYHHNSPVTEPTKSFNTVLEVVQNNPEAYQDIVNPDKWLMPPADKSREENKRENIADDYIISVYSGNTEEADKGIKRLKAQKSLFDKYNHGNWRAPGMLVNLSF